MKSFKIKLPLLVLFCLFIGNLIYSNPIGFVKMKILKHQLGKNKPNIILISIDALRADHLGCYGYRRNTSPNIDKFAKESILFINAFSQFPGTVPSHASILTGLYPNTHGATIGIDPFTLRTGLTVSLDNTVLTLAEVLKEQNYSTFGFVTSAIWLSSDLGFVQGFDHFYVISDCATRLNQNTYGIVKKFKEKSLFLFIHYMDAHSDTKQLPYDAPYPYSEIFTRKYKGNFKGGERNVYASLYLSRINLKQQHHFNKEDIQYIIDLYDQGIAYVDSEVGKLLNFLKERGLYENSLIIITSDHGEAFWEHGNFLHCTLHDEIMRVPLIIKFPYGTFKHKKITGLVESIDIMPFILKLLNLPLPKEVQGRHFLNLIQGNRRGKEYVFAGRDGYSMIRTRDKKLIYIKGKPIELYELNSDPYELNNLSKQKNIDALRLFYLLDEWNRETLAKGKSGKIANLEKQQLDTLKSLGYLQ